MISVVFSTYNGEQTLPIMLESLSKIKAPKGGWELIAVNNNSTDNSVHILEQYIDKLPLTIYQESLKGKNYALNSVLNYLKGELIVFTDDDVIPSRNWLVNMQMIADMQKKYSIFGGKIIPFWIKEPDLWNKDWIDMGVVYAISPDDFQRGETVPGNIWGPNMAIRKKIFELGYRFDTAIGPNGTKTYKMGSETSFTTKLSEEGYLCWYEPSCVVQHIIRKNQMSKRWVLNRAFRFGKGKALKVLSYSEMKNCKKFMGVPRYIYKLLLKEYLKLIWYFLTFNKEYIFKKNWQINYILGQIKEMYTYDRNDR